VRKWRVPSAAKIPPPPWTLASTALARFRQSLLIWFHREKRDLPWRRSKDPYRIWISEIMLQQTRVAAVIPYYQRFLRRFPTVQALARARIETVLQYWAGLGYYSRARNMHAAAKQIVAKCRGEFPRTFEEAFTLPGIGRYTASAILSIAFGKPLAALDGNVARVLARLGAVHGDLRAPERWRKLERAAGVMVSPSNAGDWNQAMMELGATVCTPRSPHCDACPVADACRARALGIADDLPAKRIKRAAKNVTLVAAVLLDPQGRTILVRPTKGVAAFEAAALFSRLWQFPALVSSGKPQFEVMREIRRLYEHEDISSKLVMRRLAPARHTVTFRKIKLESFLILVSKLPEAGGASAKIVRLTDVNGLAMSSATAKIASAAADFGKVTRKR
jgi:A/G-specific adenine glycosylase